jgi:hypothetical protein
MGTHVAVKRQGAITCFEDNSLYRLDLLPRGAKKTLLKELSSLHSFDVCGIVQDIQTNTVESISERKYIRETYNNIEESKEKLL